MMTTVTANVNKVFLNRGADLFFMNENIAVPFGSVRAMDLADSLDRLGADEVTVEYGTIADPKARARDEVKYTKRLNTLGGGWDRSPWTNKVVRGFVFPNVMTCTLSRCECAVDSLYPKESAT